jgi:hypothetical protein
MKKGFLFLCQNIWGEGLLYFLMLQYLLCHIKNDVVKYQI